MSVSPEFLSLMIFIFTYSGIAMGGIPGLAIDRTGIAYYFQ